MRIRSSDSVTASNQTQIEKSEKATLKSPSVNAKSTASELGSIDRTAVRQSVEAMTLDRNELQQLASKVQAGSIGKEDMIGAFVDMVVDKRFNAMSDSQMMASVKANVLECVTSDPVFGDRLKRALSELA